jgi:predicted RNase H-like HicB family nuclease
MNTTRDISSGVTEITLTAHVYREEDQYIAQCVELAAVGQGGSAEEAINDLKGAAELYLEAFPDALTKPRRQVADLVERVRQFERTYSDSIGEPVEPVDISFAGTTTFTLILADA